MKKLLTISVALLLISTGISAQNAFVSDSLDAYVKREMERWNLPGLAIAIVKDGKVVVCKGYGVKDKDTREPVNEYTLFQIASNSKAFTGTALAQLQEEKRLGLDEKVTRYMPSFKLYDTLATLQCTVRDLLTHRLGYATFQGDFLNWGSNLTRAEIISHLRLLPPKYPFRYTYGYCNAGFITAGEIIQTVTDTSWDKFLEYRFFNPMGMTHTNTSWAKMKEDKNACTPHTVYESELVKIPLANIENMGASAAINSCAADMSKWLLLQLGNGKLNNQQIVSPAAIRETRKSTMVIRDVNSKFFPTKHFSTYGLGWSIYDYNGRRVYEHSGGANGFVTKTEFIPEENLGVLVYTNSDANTLYEALAKQVIESYLNMPYRNISKIYFDASAPGKEEEQRNSDSLLAITAMKNPLPLPIKSYSGKYTNNFYGDITIKVVKNKLEIHFSHHPGNIGKLEYLSENTFLCYYSDITCGIEKVYFTQKDGHITAVKIKVNDFIDYDSYEFIKTE